MEVAGVRLTHPDKVLFPGQGVTKLDLVHHYRRVAAAILPFLAGRPVSLVRCPAGEGEACFFQKHGGAGLPGAIGRVELPETDGGTGEYLLIASEAALVAAVQMGTLELHAWGARADDIERPDRIVIDLDPDPSVGFADVKAAAELLRHVLGDLGLTGFPLVTGGKGVHVLVPIVRRHEWPVVKAFARGLAAELARREPDRFTLNLKKAARVGRIFVDYLRNERGSTAIVPWSSRARPGAPVAVPVGWGELDGLERADAFGLGDVAARLGQDPWPGWRGLRQTITRKAAARLDGPG